MFETLRDRFGSSANFRSLPRPRHREHAFDVLYRYDYLARPAKVVPNGSPRNAKEVSADFKTFTVSQARHLLWQTTPLWRRS